MSSRNIAVIVGSLRNGSYTRKVAQALVSLAPPNLAFHSIEIGDLPLYNEDLETAEPPQSWLQLRRDIAACDAVLFATPEYNRSMPAPLKNALDVGSRPYGKSVWDRKPAAVVSVTPGAMGGFGANHHLRQCLVALNMPAMQQPEAYIGGADKLFSEGGNLTVDSTRNFLRNVIESFAAWIELAAPARDA